MSDLLGSKELRDQITTAVVEAMLREPAKWLTETQGDRQQFGMRAADVADGIFQGVVAQRLRTLPTIPPKS